MNKIKSGLLIFMTLLLSNVMIAQSMEDGKKFLYYEKYKSAKNVFDKLVAADPNNADAVYWLGQTLIGMEDLEGAKSLYQKSLATNSNNPLLLAGMGHVELLENKPQDAKNRFETALSLSQNKSVPVLNAVGYANSNPDSKNGDGNYAIDKLKIATAIKGMKDPDVFVNLGDAYKKIGDGGKAQLAYESALAINPNYARASYRIGKIYQTQGQSQEEIYMKYFNEAIAKDAGYAPVYKNLSDLFYNTNVTRSAEYLDKFLANTDDDPKNCYYQASMKYAQGLFTEAITKADQCLAAPQPYWKLYGIIAYAQNKLGDSLKAKSSFEQYFAKAKPDQIGMGDYSTYANVLLKFPGNDSLAGTYVDKAVSLDSVEANKVTYLKSIASYYETQKKFKEAADWYNKIISVKKNLSKTDLYNAGYNYFRAGVYQPAIDVFNLYNKTYPDDPFGHYMIGKANWAIDSTMEQGLANPAFEKAIEVGQLDRNKYKNQLIGSYKYFVAYYANIKKDKQMAINYCDSVLAIDPADAEALNNKTVISQMNMNAPASKPTKAPAKAAEKGTKPKSPEA